MSVIDNFTVDKNAVTYLGKGLSRPECIIAESNGHLWIADNRGSLTHLAPDGTQRLLGPKEGTPNGVAMTSKGDFFVADIEARLVYRIDREGNKEVVIRELDGKPLGAVNFVYVDHMDRLWVTVSTSTEPRSAALNSQIPDGYVFLADETGVRCVADGILFTNEVRLDEKCEYLYVAETTGGGITRYQVAANGDLSNREKFGPWPLFEGAKVDGFAFDQEGNLWVTEITRNALVVVKPDGQSHTIFEDPEGRCIDFPTSVTFGGEDLKTVYVGSLKMDKIASFRSPIAGAPMVHWDKA